MNLRNTPVSPHKPRRSTPAHCGTGSNCSGLPIPVRPAVPALLTMLLLTVALLAGCAGITETADAPVPAPGAAEASAAESTSPTEADDESDSGGSGDDVVDVSPSGPVYTGDEPGWNDRYAVALYGIRQDEILIEDGEAPVTATAGLTFGPATGRHFQTTYRAHVQQEAYLEDPEANPCLHWMSWEEIAEQSKQDPTVFEPCLEYGCTHAVNLMLNEKLLHRDYSADLTGDGASALLDSIKRGFLSWNAGYAHADGWPACRARAVLNGADGFSNVKEVREAYMLAPEESLFSCFPEELQQLIAAKKVISDLNNDNGSPDCVTTYDKLWLFSRSELYKDASPSEGDSYQRALLIRSEQAGFGGGYRMYPESGSEAYAWLRSISPLEEVINRHIYGGGHWTGSGYYNVYALTPGFCLP